MQRILPFKGLKYNKNIVGNLSAVISPPYDVISTETQKMLYDSHPFNVIRLEYGMTGDADSDTDNRYTRSAETLQEWMHSGVLVPDRQPSVYIYGQEFTAPDGRQLFCRGVICLVRLEDYETGEIVPHEETLSKAKADRLKLMNDCGANFNPVFALYSDETGRVTNIVSKATVRAEETSFKATDGTVQKLWQITDDEALSEICRELDDKQFFIADGHHRYEAAINYRNAMREKNPEHTGDEPYNYIMMFLADMDDPGLVILPTHRMVKNVVGYSEQVTVTQLEHFFDIEKIESQEIETLVAEKLAGNTDMPSFAMITGKDYFYFLRLKNYLAADEENKGKSEALRHLDVTVLHSLILGKVFDMTGSDVEKQTYLAYTRDISRAVSQVKAGNCQCAFILNPTGMDKIKEILLAKEKLPQKSTYFYPTLKTGIVMNKFN